MIYRLVTPATEEPIALEDAKIVCAVDSDIDGEDAHIERLIVAARDFVQMELAAAGNPLRLAPETWQASAAYWPRASWIDLGVLPVTALSSVVYQEVSSPDGVLVEVEMALSEFHLQIEQARLYRWAATTWPEVVLGPEGWTVTFGVGFSTATLPPALYQAMLMLVAHWFENREAAVAGSEFRAEAVVVPLGYRELVAPFLRGRVL
ncbi:MAG: head-tail connector protein [Caldilinea sp.]